MHPVPGRNDPCQGPNHGNPHALPPGERRWVKGHMISLTQQVDGQADSHVVFCCSDCMCDWHGAYEAFAQDNENNPEFQIPGRFTLIWCSPAASTVGVYEDWDALTEQIGGYQQRLLRLREAQQPWRPPYQEG